MTYFHHYKRGDGPASPRLPCPGLQSQRHSFVHFIGGAVLGLAAILVPATGNAHHLLHSYPLQCDATFPCPDDLRRRVDLWIAVFARYGDNEVILHDSKRPERIYSIINSANGCSRRRDPGDIKRERTRLATELRRVADSVAAGSKLSDEEHHIALLFQGESPNEIKAAADRIRCQDGNRHRFTEALQRYGTYRPIVLDALRQAGLPEDIQYLPFVESAYNPRAYSRVGAAGMWQIMPRTARRLGLQVGGAIDERLDPVAASLAAARYLQQSHEILSQTANGKQPAGASIFPFVITSYNYGVPGMRRAIDSMGIDFVKVINEYRARAFQVAVKNFYASFLAARHVARNADSFFPGISPHTPTVTQEIVLKADYDTATLSRVLGVTEEDLRQLNPSLLQAVWQGRYTVPRGFLLRVPRRPDNYTARLATLEQTPPTKVAAAEEDYRVRRGDTACAIASAHSVSCSELMQANGLGRRALIQVGQILKIPGAKKTTVAAATTAPSPPAATSLDPQIKVPVPVPVPAPLAAKPEPVQIPLARTAKSLTPEEVAAAFGIGGELFVEVVPRAGSKLYSVRVEPEETLGHYADWLGTGSTNELLQANKLGRGASLPIGRRIRLPINSDTQRIEFEKKRIEFHRSLEEEFLAHYQITGQEEYRVRAGDTGWDIADEHEIPVWLLRRFNPELLFRPPQIGDIVRLPVVEERGKKKS